MMQIKVRNSFQKFSIKYVLLSIIATAITWFTTRNVVVSLIIFCLGFSGLLSCFVVNIIFDENYLKITYYKFLFKRDMELLIKEVEINHTRRLSIRSNEYFLFNIINKGRKIFEMDTRDIYSYEELEKLENEINKLKTMQSSPGTQNK